MYTALQAVASPLGHSTEQTPGEAFRADDGIRTRDPHLGKVMRYQLRYVRTLSEDHPERSLTLPDERGALQSVPVARVCVALIALR